VSAFVEECRREWKRLGVPDLIAEEMATDLGADLEEAEAEGVGAEQLLGGGADPRRFAADWAQARGVATGEPEVPRRPRRLIVAAAAILVIGGTAAAAAVLAGGHTRPATPPPHAQASAVVPDFVGAPETEAIAGARASGFRVNIVLQWPTPQPSGTVLAQLPTAGLVTPRGATITLRVAGQRQPKETTKP